MMGREDTSFTEEHVKIAVAEKYGVTAVRTVGGRPARKMTFVYAPGAGSNLDDPFAIYACRRLAEQGLTAVRFQFPYMEAGRRGPDPPARLEKTWRAVVAAIRKEDRRLVIGGRSMGGRIASQVVAQGTAVDGLALFAYPLHPPGKRDQWRDQHLPSIGVPTLFCSGTRDTFGTPQELQLAASKVLESTIHFLEGANHGFAVPKSSGRTKEDVWVEAVEVLDSWLGGLPHTGQ